MMKIGNAILAGTVAMFLCVSAQAGVADRIVADRIVAVVNDEVITLSELNNAFEPYQERFTANYQGRDREKALGETRAALLNRMIDNLLMEQESRKTGITVRSEEVTDAINDMQKQRKVSPDEFQKALQQEGMTLDAYRKDIRDQLVRLKLIRRDIKSKVAVTDEEIGEYYRKHREDYEGKEAVRIKQILLLLPKEENPAAKEKLRADADAIHKRLLNGEPFEMLSAKFSQGPAAAEGGDIGYIERGMIHSEVEDAAFTLPLNQISGVIESPVGFHIIQVVDRRGAGLKAIENVREEIREKIDREKMEKKFGEWLAELRKKSHIEIKL
ncbi:MAG: SurA N-terminal domain-containing protein [Proteobacteria bacterium]|nr:SurA N-terminal domain-containing protein [Pseudomonadota bacterium]MBU4581123.1 SurA N-terminal domain-containing protein [Pseudomonadota bacterium]MCG2739706.1 SurA N-terminal domain-containing protein [Syntrophaceae bacterium]